VNVLPILFVDEYSVRVVDRKRNVDSKVVA